MNYLMNLPWQKIPGLSLLFATLIGGSIFYTKLAQSQIALDQIRGISSPLREEYQHLSPIDGIIWNEGKMLKNVNDLAPSTPPNPLKNLIKDLYHQEDEFNFVPTNVKSKLSVYLHPLLLGKIQGFIEVSKNYSKKKISKENILSQFKELISSDERFQTLQRQHEEEIQRFLSIIKELYLKDILNPEEAITFNNLKKDLNRYLAVKEDQIPALIKDFPHTRLIETFRKELKKNISTFTSQAIAEIHNPRLPRVLNALLWSKVTKKEDFLTYYKGLSFFIPTSHLLVTDDILTNEDKRKAFSSLRFEGPPSIGPDENVLSALKSENGQYKSKLTSADLEKILFQQKSIAGQATPIIRQGYPTLHGQSFPDCGETSLRNFFKIILQKNGTYDVSILENLEKEIEGLYLPGQKKRPNHFSTLKMFFKEFPSSDAQLLPEARQKWAEITSNLNNVDYRYCLNPNRFDISSQKGQFNMHTVLDELLGLPQPLLISPGEAKEFSWIDFFSLISRSSGREIKLVQTPKPSLTAFGQLSFITPHEGKFTWHFTNGHYYISPDVDSKLDEQNRSDQNIIFQMVKGDWFQREFDLLSIYPTDDFKIEYFTKKFLSQPQPHDPHLLMILDGQTNETTFAIFKSLLANKTEDQNQVSIHADILKGLYKRLTNLDFKTRFLSELPLEFAPIFISEFIAPPYKECRLQEILTQPTNHASKDFQNLLTKLAILDVGRVCEKYIKSYIKAYLQDGTDKSKFLNNILPYGKNQYLTAFLIKDLLSSYNKGGKNEEIDLQSLRFSDWKSLAQLDVNLGKCGPIQVDKLQIQIDHLRNILWSPLEDYAQQKQPSYKFEGLIVEIFGAAVEAGHTKMVRKIKTLKDVDIDRVNCIGRTPLFNACFLGKTEIVDELLNNENTKSRINVNVQDAAKYSILSVLIYQDNKELLRKFLSLPNINLNISNNYGETPLIQASKLRDTEFLKILLQQPQIDVNTLDHNGRTAIHHVAGYSNLDSIKALLGHEKTQINLVDKNGDTALDIAIYFNATPIIMEFLNHPNYDPNKFIKADQLKQPLLNHVINNGNMEIVNKLLEHGRIDVNQGDKYSNTPLFLSITKNREEVLRKLLHRPDTDLNATTYKGNSILHLASIINLPRFVEIILERVPNFANALNEEGLTPLMLAALDGHSEVINVLLKNGKVMDGLSLQSPEGETALSIAERKGHQNVVDLLKEAAASRMGNSIKP